MDTRQPIALAYPFRGRCQVRNSPANRVPSHGTDLYATTYAIDFVPVDTRSRSAPYTLRSVLWPEPPEVFVGFGWPVLAPVAGTVVAVHDGESDHDAYRGLPSVRYALTQRERAAAGPTALTGNSVVIEAAPGVLVALCHLRRGSILVALGGRVAVGDAVGACGNSGNSTEPHVHLQAMDHLDPERAKALPISFDGRLPRNGDIVAA
ncbi:M23 family metallopeptidase [Raineyella fluvialis]|uniref:Peptidoglycan DD-metalloendopeptidase family protein n=1 Tax=Raineyella fluvialis TaxID=2662261 RepID=A0A5Q2F6I6_9ACTN|nr:M23 family metallopeptidase [Raineyella fluvialis]QGF22590.1 peptidoglycan DD-metalloendopeptidase family protein [Raineyella fluvialis]